MAETMDKQRLLNELRRGTGIVPQAAVSDKQKILDSLRQLPVKSDSTNYFAPISQGENAKSYVSHLSNKSTFAPIIQDKTAKDFVSHLVPEKESQGYFQAGMLDDKDKNVAEKVAGTYVGTAADVSQNVYSSGLGMGEKVLDFLATIAPYIAAASPWGETAISAPSVHRQAQKQQLESGKQLASEFVEKDLYDEDKIARKIVTDPLKKYTGIDADTDSVLGEKSDAVVQSLAQMAATAAMGGTVPWWVVTGATSFGGEAENALKQGATLEQAGLSAAASAGAEILTEKLFGGSGLGEKGFLNLDVLTKKISNKLVKTLLDYGVDMAAEGAEEVVSSFASNLASSLYREENLSEILFSEEALQEYLDSFVSGAAVGGLMNVGKVGSSIANKTDYRNGLTAQEQKVFDTEYNAAIADAQKSGKLTKEQKAEIYDSVLEDVISRRPAPQQAATPTQSGETAQSEKVPTQAEMPTQDAQTAQTPSQPMAPQQTVSESVSDISSVRTQLRASQSELNAMQPVADVQVSQEFTQLDKAGKLSWIAEKLRPTGYKVERKGFGVINFAKKQISKAFKYFDKGGAEEAAFEALPYVLENGTEISSRDDHKGRNYGTVTIAAPVTINGKRGNMAVVVKQTTDNYYKVHRILTPDGSVFNLSEVTSEAESTIAGESPKNGSLATPKDSASNASIAQDGSNVNTQNDLPEHSVGAAMPHKTKRSRVIENTYANATDPEMRAEGEAALKEDPDIGIYSVIPESESRFESEQRTRDEEDMQREYDYLMEKRGGWTSADNDTAMKLRDYFYQKADQRFADIVQRQAEEGTQAGQFIQSFAKYTRMTGEDAAAEVVVEMDKLKESDVPKRFYQDGGFEQWKGDVITSSMNIAKQIDSVEDGDVDGMKDIIRSMAKWRKTTAWFGLSSDLSKAAEAAMKDIDFETAKAIANAQLSTLTSDFKKRPVGQVVKTIRIHNMLSSLTTINRNLVGNTAVGFIDATSDSTSGRLIDALVSKVTGKRTVGNDIKYGKTYMDAAWKATKMASLCAELDIPMDSESRFTTGTTRTYSPQGNPIMRFMSAYEKYMKYALEVTDQFYQGGANAAVDASLQEISGNETLTQEEAEAIAKLAGQRRTLKDERAATRMAKQVRQGLNEFGTESMGLGDLTMPFASIGSTSAHVAVDYTAGTVTGLAQVFKLMHDVKHGRYVDGVKTIYKNGKPVRTVTLAEAQRAAVTNAGRGITGLGLVTAFAGMAAAGILKVHDDKDKDKRGLEQAQNLSGAQLNIDAALRGLQGKSTEWQADDLVISVDFLEPFNAQMYLGYLLSQDESVLDAVKSYTPNALRSVMASIADMPAMQGMQEALDILSGLQDVSDEEGGLAQWAADSAGQVIGSTASGFIPGWLRQMAQVIDPYYRDTSGDTATDAALNQVKAAIPGLSQTLPKKYSGLGQEQLRDDDWISGIFNTMVNPGDADRIKTTEVTDFLDELYDLTGDLGIYPDAAAPKSFTQDKKTYTISTKEETETYQKTYGSEVNKLYSEIIKSADFKGLDETDQAAVLEKAKDAARALAKSKISGKYTPPSSIKNKPIYKSDAQAILDAYLEAKRKAEKEAQKKAAKEAYLATKNGQ